MFTSDISNRPILQAFLADSDDAVSMMDVVQNSLTDTIRDSIKTKVGSAESLISVLVRMGSLAGSIFKNSVGPFLPINTLTLEVTPKTTESLAALFLADGPSLGHDLSEANQNFQSLTDFGFAAEAPVQVPVMVEIIPTNGGAPIKSIAWFSPDQVAPIQTYPSGGTAIYPGSNVYVQDVKDGSGNVVSSNRFTVFDAYANRRPSLIVAYSALVTLIAKASAIEQALAIELATAVKAADKVEKIIEDNQSAVKIESSTREQEKLRRQTDLNEVLRLIREQRQERENLSLRLEASIKLNDRDLARDEKPSLEILSQIKPTEKASSSSHTGTPAVEKNSLSNLTASSTTDTASASNRTSAQAAGNSSIASIKNDQ